jgi:hypothetical protein
MQTMSKFKIAIFGQFPWQNLAKVPLILFYKTALITSSLYAKDIVAQWVYPHLTALSYLRHHQTVYRTGADIRELFIEEPAYIAIDEIKSG